MVMVYKKWTLSGALIIIVACCMTDLSAVQRPAEKIREFEMAVKNFDEASRKLELDTPMIKLIIGMRRTDDEIRTSEEKFHSSLYQAFNKLEAAHDVIKGISDATLEHKEELKEIKRRIEEEFKVIELANLLIFQSYFDYDDFSEKEDLNDVIDYLQHLSYMITEKTETPVFKLLAKKVEQAVQRINNEDLKRDTRAFIETLSSGFLLGFKAAVVNRSLSQEKKAKEAQVQQPESKPKPKKQVHFAQPLVQEAEEAQVQQPEVPLHPRKFGRFEDHPLVKRARLQEAEREEALKKREKE